MKAAQVDQALAQKFVVEGARLVFWHDPNGEFTGYVEQGFSGNLEGVQVLNVAQVGGLSAKLLLEREDVTGKFLVYSQGAVLSAEQDWLLDIRHYSAQFHADVASLWLQELGLSNLSMRDHLKARSAFLANQDRRRKLGKLVSPTDANVAIDLKMMAVLVGSDIAGAFDVLRALCHGHVAESTAFELEETPEAISLFEKMGLLEPFWQLMNAEFSYAADTPTIAGLLRGLFVTELMHQTATESFGSLSHYQLPHRGRRNAAVFLAQWRDSSRYGASYDATANAIATEQSIKDPLASLELDVIRQSYTFWEAEPLIASRLKDSLLADTQVPDAEAIASVVSGRSAGHWLSGPGRDLPERQAIANAYEAIVAAAALFALRGTHGAAFAYDAPGDLLAAYEEDLYRFDRHYREFWVRARPSLSLGWNLLKSLGEEVERVYDQGFLQPLGLEWSRHLDAGFLGTWNTTNLPAQQAFYNTAIKPHLAGSERKRAFVIISDALRYEAGRELTETLNGRFRMEAKLSSMLGVLPSYTALGMASLLPHNTLEYNDKGDVLVDGKSTAGTEARNAQLATVQGMACLAKELQGMKSDDARAFTEGKRVVYIYHNVIDARGDSASTESETFQAVSDCIAELADLVAFCVNKCNAAKVWVTADHGFLYQQNAPGETDKSKLSHKPEQAVKVKKRYVVGPKLGASEEAHHGSTSVTAGAEGGMEFWVPRGANRFHFTGGARFVHGGAMPQEVLIPVVTVTQLRGDKAERSKVTKVGVTLIGGNHKITTPKHRFEVIQTDPVSDRTKPLTVRAAIYEGTEPVTSVESITFDSESASMDERKKSLRLELRRGTFDKSTAYRLVLRDADTDVEVLTTPVVIDRSFDDDF